MKTHPPWAPKATIGNIVITYCLGNAADANFND